jgi:hypothetical protein
MSRQVRLYFGGKRPDVDPPIPPLFMPPQPSRDELQRDAANIRRRLEEARVRIDAEAARLDAQEQQLLELEEVIDEL